jgi:anti-sigma factor RsiW
MKCNFDRTKLILYLFDELAPVEQEEANAHLKSCEHCALELEQMNSVLDTWPSQQQIEPPLLQVAMKLEEKRSAHQRMIKKRARKFLPAFGFAVAVAIFAFLGSWFLGDNKKSNFWSLENSWEGSYRYHFESIDRTVETIKKDNFFN